MARNPRRKAAAGSSPSVAAPISARPPLFSRRGKKTIAAGIGVVIVGFVVLTFTDPAGQNWASTLSPFLLIAGYAAIGVGTILP